MPMRIMLACAPNQRRDNRTAGGRENSLMP
jgi:hypothetical protein